MFFANRLRSSLSRRSFCFFAPGRLLRLLLPLCAPELGCPLCADATSGSESARDSSVATSFFDGRRRLVVDLAFAFSILERNTDDLMARLSRLEPLNAEADADADASARYMRCFWRDFDLGVTGALVYS